MNSCTTPFTEFLNKENGFNRKEVRRAVYHVHRVYTVESLRLHYEPWRRRSYKDVDSGIGPSVNDYLRAWHAFIDRREGRHWIRKHDTRGPDIHEYPETTTKEE